MPFGGFAPLPIRLGGTALNGLTAAQHARISADLVAMAKSAPLARIGLTTGQTVVSSYQAQWETGVANAPTITIGGAGAGWARATWDAGFLDPYGNYQAISITGADVGAAGVSLIRTSYIIDAPNVVTVYSTAQNGFALDDIEVFLVVY